MAGTLGPVDIFDEVMSETLTQPPGKFRKAVEWITTASPTRRIVFYLIAGIVLLGLVLFAFDRCSRWWSTRQIDKLKANVNAATQELANAQANINLEKQAEAVALEKVKDATNAYIEATNATDTAKAETNRALQNLESAVNANRSVGITAEQLDRQLRELDR